MWKSRSSTDWTSASRSTTKADNFGTGLDEFPEDMKTKNLSLNHASSPTALNKFVRDIRFAVNVIMLLQFIAIAVLGVAVVALWNDAAEVRIYLKDLRNMPSANPAEVNKAVAHVYSTLANVDDMSTATKPAFEQMARGLAGNATANATRVAAENAAHLPKEALKAAVNATTELISAVGEKMREINLTGAVAELSGDKTVVGATRWIKEAYTGLLSRYRKIERIATVVSRDLVKEVGEEET